MAVITTDILLTGIRRDDVLEWLRQASNQRAILEGAFDDLNDVAEGQFELTVKCAPKTRVVGYRFVEVDESHGGRRIVVATSGKRTSGHLHYSLRTMKPSTNTLVTLHMDYEPGGLLGQVINSSGLSEALETGWSKVLDNLGRLIPREG